MGGRPREVSDLRWRDWDRTPEPLTRFVIVRAMRGLTKRVGRTKTRPKKIVPVHPVAAQLLAAWHARGWRAFMGRAPTDDDLIVPNQLGARRNV